LARRGADDRRLKTDDCSLSDNNREDAGAGLSWSEVGADGFPHGEAVALIAAETNRGRCAVLLERDKRDIHGRSIFADDRSELYKAHRTTHAGNPAGKGATDKDIPASRTDQNQANYKKS
jgi:hypothetical protein